MKILNQEITPEAVYLNRREILHSIGAGAVASAPLLGGLAALSATSDALAQTKLPSVKSTVAGALVTDKPTDFKDASSYNNFYEFTTDKDGVASKAQALVTSPWNIRVEGLVTKPFTIGLEDLLKLAPMEERIYRLRCVEGWSMVIPWLGYSLAKLIAKAQPLGSAKYIEFVTLSDAKTMPGVRENILDWPYTEGLRLDEAMHPLTLLGFGMYGQTLPKQNGAPVRLVVPWKYGFKSAKSIVTIRFTEKQPQTAWGRSAPQEYGFFSNVNPDVAHPRWSQSSERRIGEEGGLFAKKLKTQLFNGYAEQVGQLYAGMDLRKFF